MFLRAKDMMIWMAFSSLMGAQTIGEAIELFKTFNALKNE